MFTEEEASLKICPFTFAVPAESERHPGPFTCIASKCMAWRKVSQIGIGPNGEKRDRDHDGRTRWKDVGVCGLVGKSEGA